MGRPSVYDENAVLSKAAELFANYGYQNITIQQLAERLGIAKPTLYVHGKSKQKLLEAINYRFLVKVEQGLLEARNEPNPAQRIKTLIHSWTTLYVEERPSIRVFHSENNEISKESRALLRDRASVILKTLTRMVGDAQRTGNIDANVPSRFYAYTLLGTINWMPRWYSSESWTVDDITQNLIKVIFVKTSPP